MSDSRSKGSLQLGLMEMLVMLTAEQEGGASRGLPERSYADLDELIASFEAQDNPVSRLEGPAVYLGDGIVALRRCPFTGSFVPLDGEGALPEYAPSMSGQLAQRFADPEAAVGPFCHVHQALRWACSQAMNVGGRRLEVYQLGCRSASGKVALASARIAELGIDEGRVREALVDHACCYCLRLAAADTSASGPA